MKIINEKTNSSEEVEQRLLKLEIFYDLDDVFRKCAELEATMIVKDPKKPSSFKSKKCYKLSLKSHNLDLFPELDPMEEMYTVCYNCMQKNVPLLQCPRCELVYFCSEYCNLMDVLNEGSNAHECKYKFYGKEPRGVFDESEIIKLRLNAYKQHLGPVWRRADLNVEKLLKILTDKDFEVERAFYLKINAPMEEYRRLILDQIDLEREMIKMALGEILARIRTEERDRLRFESEMEQKTRRDQELEEIQRRLEIKRQEEEALKMEEEIELMIEKMATVGVSEEDKKKGLIDILKGVKTESLAKQDLTIREVEYRVSLDEIEFLKSVEQRRISELEVKEEYLVEDESEEIKVEEEEKPEKFKGRTLIITDGSRSSGEGVSDYKVDESQMSLIEKEEEEKLILQLSPSIIAGKVISKEKLINTLEKIGLPIKKTKTRSKQRGEKEITRMGKQNLMLAKGLGSIKGRLKSELPEEGHKAKEHGEHIPVAEEETDKEITEERERQREKSEALARMKKESLRIPTKTLIETTTRIPSDEETEDETVRLSLLQRKTTFKRSWSQMTKEERLEQKKKEICEQIERQIPYRYDELTENVKKRKGERELDYGVPVEGDAIKVDEKMVTPLAGFIYKPWDLLAEEEEEEPEIKKARSAKEKVVQLVFGRPVLRFDTMTRKEMPKERFTAGASYGAPYLVDHITGKPTRFITWDEGQRFPGDRDHPKGWAYIELAPREQSKWQKGEEYQLYQPLTFGFGPRGQFEWGEPQTPIKSNMVGIPLHIQNLLFKMSSYFAPDADLSNLFPFMVLRNGELYYKFYRDQAQIENYSFT